MTRDGTIGRDNNRPRLSREVGAGRCAGGDCRNVHAQEVYLMWRCGMCRGGLSSGCGRGNCDRGSGLGAVRQQLLQHAAQGLHASCVVLVEPCLKLVVEPADKLLGGLLVSQKAVCQGCHALVQVGTKVVRAAVKLLPKGVKLGLDVADDLGLLHS